jgi:hypothetical protein
MKTSTTQRSLLGSDSCSASSTPGPWHCESSLGLVRSAADQRIICAMPHALNKRAIKMRKPGDDVEITPDAILIAAAPELRSALASLLEIAVKLLDEAYDRGETNYPSGNISEVIWAQAALSKSGQNAYSPNPSPHNEQP